MAGTIVSSADEEDPLAVAERALERYPLCDRCLGRLFAGLGRGLSNAERGRALKLTIVMRLYQRALQGDQAALARLEGLAPNMGGPAIDAAQALTGRRPEARACYICGGLLEGFISSIVDKVANGLRIYGASRFLIGVHVDRSVISREEEVKASTGARFGESIGREIKREVGKAVQLRYGLVPDFDRPDAVALISFPDGAVEVQVRRITVGGTYKRTSRDNPIKPYRGHPLLDRIKAIYDAEDASVVGLVRDEGGVRVLGAGVPVVVLLSRAKVREGLKKGDLVQASGAELSVEGVGVARPLEEELSRRSRLYRCVVLLGRDVSEPELSLAVQSLSGRQVTQRVHGKEIKGTVRGISCTPLTPRVVECLVHIDERLYVMELVSGQGTSPSLASALGTEATCALADLLEAG